MSPGPIALVGSGEYLPAMLDVERELLDGRAPRYVQIPTAAGRESDASVQRWVRLGREQAERLGVTAVPVVARDRAAADDTATADLVAGAGLVYLSGGDPTYLASTLRGTALWHAVRAAWESGAALAGCSAGAMALTGWVPSLRLMHREPDPGLGLLPHLRVFPHFDRMVGRIPDLLRRAVLPAVEGVTVLGIDEETALVGGPETWTVAGHQSAWTLTGTGRVEHRPGDVVVTPAA